MKIKNKKIYDGYGACPIFVGGKKVLLAEFSYNAKVSETFGFDQSKANFMFYLLKKNFFPFIYWNIMPRGIWHGKAGIKKKVY